MFTFIRAIVLFLFFWIFVGNWSEKVEKKVRVIKKNQFIWIKPFSHQLWKWPFFVNLKKWRNGGIWFRETGNMETYFGKTSKLKGRREFHYIACGFQVIFFTLLGLIYWEERKRDYSFSMLLFLAAGWVLTYSIFGLYSTVDFITGE